jgi:hypothetical protein
MFTSMMEDDMVNKHESPCARQVGQHDPVSGHGCRREGQLRPSRYADGPHSLRPGHEVVQEFLLIQLRPLRPLRR